MGGYQSLAYARAVSSDLEPLSLPRSGGFLVQRELTPGVRDAANPYPIFCCSDWSGLAADVASLEGQVSVTVVTDPLGTYDAGLLATAFPDLTRPFKSHFVVDLRASPETYVARHHQRNARRALSEVKVDLCADAEREAEEWLRLYRNLVGRHAISGAANFSESSLKGQLGVPGLTAFTAKAAGRTVGMVLWMVTNGRAYYHLAAYSAEGYKLGASFALFWTSLEHFSSTVAVASLGGGAGLDDAGDDGLTRFKRGWATGTQTAYICGRILDHDRYEVLSARRGAIGDIFFPAYRGRP